MDLVKNSSPIDILILSNGPGEVMTWVRPVVQALRSPTFPRLAQARISVILAPCPHASGQEAEVVKGFPEVDRVQGADGFWSFLLWGETQQNWDWRTKGVVLFLGGDQFSAVAAGKRLGYKIVTYVEWTARWLQWIDGCGVTQTSEKLKAPAKFQAKIHVIGDLIAEAQVLQPLTEPVSQILNLTAGAELVGLLPGSKSMKLSLLLPMGMAIAHYLHQIRPQVQMIIPVAPTLKLPELCRYVDPILNTSFDAVRGAQATLVEPKEGLPYLLTDNGARVLLWQRVPAYELMAHCKLCITTVGANTAELASLAVPMLVLLPTQQLDAMRAWDGIPGLLANLPLVGKGFAKLINAWILKQGLGLKAWPNIWAGREIVPEWVGHILPEAVGDRIVTLLNNPAELEQMRTSLKQIRGEPGAAQRLATLVEETLSQKR
jgi:hypothetical protein